MSAAAQPKRDLAAARALREQRICVIIPCVRWDETLSQCIREVMRQQPRPSEVIIVTDRPHTGRTQPGVRALIANTSSPAGKRNQAAASASPGTTLLAFIDADAYPAEDWLSNAVLHLADPAVKAVGGPNLTPADDSPLGQRSGRVLACATLMGFRHSFYKPFSGVLKAREFNSCNMVVRAKAFNDVGGFDESFRTGEDLVLSRRLMKCGGTLVFSGDIVVYHYRRPYLIPLLRQWFTYGKSVFRLVRTERDVHSLALLLPLFLMAYVALLAVAAISRWPVTAGVYAPLGAYLLAISIDSLIHARPPWEAPFLFTGIIGIHLASAAGTIVGGLNMVLGKPVWGRIPKAGEF